MYSDILIRFGELSTKGKNKMTFVRKLEQNIQKLVGATPQVEYDRMFLKYDDTFLDKLKYVFGIYSYSPVIKVPSNLESMAKAILTILQKEEGTFKVVAKRHWKEFPMTSSELNNHFGQFIIEQKGFCVNIKDPQIRVEIEIRKNWSYVFIKRHLGLGGYPTGINGKVLHLISGGIDSPVAALSMMKRGIHVDFLNFVTPPHTDKKTEEKVTKIIELLARYQGKAKLFRFHYTDLMNLIGLTSLQSYKITLMRRSFYRIASILVSKYNYLGISNGDNLGQVASQTLESVIVIQDQATLPVYRPILTSDKIETINRAKAIGTYSISIQKANESCEIFAPKKPVIKPTILQAQKLELELSGLKKLEKSGMGDKITEIQLTYNHK